MAGLVCRKPDISPNGLFIPVKSWSQVLTSFLAAVKRKICSSNRKNNGNKTTKMLSKQQRDETHLNADWRRRQRLQIIRMQQVSRVGRQHLDDSNGEPLGLAKRVQGG